MWIPDRQEPVFSNENGESGLEIKSAHLARQIDAKSSEIDTSTDTALTFEGKESVVIPAGGTVTSDAVEYPVETRSSAAVGSREKTGLTTTCSRRQA